jgi:regulator of protease activity HflC (stomatin/prohibitin superfamily)
MKLWRKVVVGDAERGLMYRNRRFERVLAPGVYRRWAWPRREVCIFDTAQNEHYAGKDVDALIERLGAALAEHFVVADIGVDEAGLVSRNGKLAYALSPGTRTLYWRGATKIEVERVALGAGLEVPADVARRLRQLDLLARYAVVVAVPEQHVGLLFVDGKLARSLESGSYAFWNFGRNVVAEVTDLRVQGVEVSGQEMLTRDKVSLRVNLAASYRVVDAVAARTRVAKYAEHVYRELQFGLRKAVASKSLDELLGDKASLDGDIFAWVRGRVTEFGVEMLGVGVKDVILPGEMKEILNAVVQAEKSAQANVIRRREEANAMRSALNTARLIEDSPTLMRLKELEVLEKVTEKIDKLTVFGGLDGLMKQLVGIKQ